MSAPGTIARASAASRLPLGGAVRGGRASLPAAMPVADAPPADLPATACAWCGADLPAGTDRSGGRARCDRCGAATTDPWPSQSTLEDAYRGWYRPETGRFSGPGDALLKRSRGALAKRLDKITPPGGPVLDVGAGDGTLLDALRRTGRDATGLELVSTRPDIEARDITDLDPDPRYAAIVFWHSLEHLPQPGRALEAAARLLVPGGVLVVAVPNSDSLQAKAFKDRWLALDMPRHLVHLPANALIERMQTDGLRVTRTSHLRGGQVVFGWLHGLTGTLPGHPDLYDAIRRPGARSTPMTPRSRATTLAAAAALTPVAAAAALAEAALKRGGSIYVEAVR
jgi:SAM-dependent methyltransferase